MTHEPSDAIADGMLAAFVAGYTAAESEFTVPSRRPRDEVQLAEWKRFAETDVERRALIAAAAADTAPATPPAGTVPVRVAVALDEEGHYAGVSKISEGESESLIWDDMAECGYPRRSCIATIHAPIPPVPELPATVEAPDA